MQKLPQKLGKSAVRKEGRHRHVEARAGGIEEGQFSNMPGSAPDKEGT